MLFRSKAIYELLSSGNRNEIYNVCAENLFSNLEIVKTVCEWNSISDYEKHIEFVPNRECQDNKYKISNKKLKKNCSFIPLKDEIKNFIKNKNFEET